MAGDLLRFRHMSRSAFLTLLSSIVFLMSSNSTAAEPEGSLTPEFIQKLQDDYEMSSEDRARFNAVSGTGIETLALNREIVNGEDGHFSHRIKTKGITNQKSSGRCWMFAGFNTMRPSVIHKLGLEEFEFSASYLLFWDKMEKSNLYLEQVIELRDADRLDREWELINKAMIGDGGWWNYVSTLIDKYGVVPKSVMPETHSSENTRAMNTVLKRLLLSRSASILKESEGGAELETLREMKKEAMVEVYRFLAINLGEPPSEFEWRFKSKKGNTAEKEESSEPDKDTPVEETPTVEVADLSDWKTYTPKQFYQEHVGSRLDDYVTLYHDPALDLGAHYIFSRARNVAGAPEMNFVTVEIDTLKNVAVESVKANQAMWFAVNMGPDQSRKHGIMEKDLFDYESLFGIEMPLTKADRSRFQAGASNHAMVLLGVDLKDDKPVKWLVENSWGKDNGNNGTWTLYDSWFNEHVYTITVHKDFVDPDILKSFEQEAKRLPTWYPGAGGVE